MDEEQFKKAFEEALREDSIEHMKAALKYSQQLKKERLKKLGKNTQSLNEYEDIFFNKESEQDEL
jgi:hypothetical protein